MTGGIDVDAELKFGVFEFELLQRSCEESIAFSVLLVNWIEGGSCPLVEEGDVML